MLHIHLSHEAPAASSRSAEKRRRRCRSPRGAGGPVTRGQFSPVLGPDGLRMNGYSRSSTRRTPPRWTATTLTGEIAKPCSLRMPASCFPYAAGSRRMDLDHTNSVPAAGTWWPAGPNRGAQPRPDEPPRTSHQNPQPMAGPTTRTRRLDLAITALRLLPGHERRNPIPRQRPIRATSLAGGSASETSGRHGCLGATRRHSPNRCTSQNLADTVPRLATSRAAAMAAQDHHCSGDFSCASICRWPVRWPSPVHS